MSDAATWTGPTYDPELAAALADLPDLPPINQDTLTQIHRPATMLGLASIQPRLDELNLVHEEVTVEGPRGEIVMSVIRADTPRTGSTLLFSIHGGGMISGDRFSNLVSLEHLDWVAEHNLVLVTPEYRLSPEFPGRSSVEDCYAGLTWAVHNADRFGIDRERVIVAGASGGGGVAAGTVLLARDSGGPKLLAQLLICPQLDDRRATSSYKQYTRSVPGVILPNEDIAWAWDAVLGPGHEERTDIDTYAAPARTLDLSGLPPTYVDAGAAEIFRDEAIDYAARLLAAGVQTELHIWRGGHHGFDGISPTAAVSIMSRTVRKGWLARTLND
ncbi:MAG: alpha/beta hydrolase [Actinomycetota bacterium]|nr:alpha/beta hydrolase [Actinomycetota bacterium]